MAIRMDREWTCPNFSREVCREAALVCSELWRTRVYLNERASVIQGAGSKKRLGVRLDVFLAIIYG